MHCERESDLLARNMLMVARLCKCCFVEPLREVAGLWGQRQNGLHLRRPDARGQVLGERQPAFSSSRTTSDSPFKAAAKIVFFQCD